MNLAGHASDNFGQIARRLRSVVNEIGGTVLLTTSMLCRWATKRRVATPRLAWVGACEEWSSCKKILHRIIRTWRVSSKKAAADVTDRVCDAVNHACSWYPKRARCLQRSAATACLLKKYGVPAQMVIGAQH